MGGGGGGGGVAAVGYTGNISLCSRKDTSKEESPVNMKIFIVNC